MMQKQVLGESPRIPENFRKWGGGPIITSGLWPSWVILPLGPWSLPRGRGGPAGNWSRPALEARWRIYICMYDVIGNRDIGRDGE